MSRHAGTTPRYSFAVQQRIFDEVRDRISGRKSDGTKTMKRTQRATRSQATTRSSREFPATFLCPKSPWHGKTDAIGSCPSYRNSDLRADFSSLMPTCFDWLPRQDLEPCAGANPFPRRYHYFPDY